MGKMDEFNSLLVFESLFLRPSNVKIWIGLGKKIEEI